MIHGFETKDEQLAVSALCVYAVYRSRDKQRFKVDTQMWDRIERFTKSAAKRASTAGEFIERLKPRLCCSSLRPRWCTTDVAPTSGAEVLRDEDGGLSGIIVRGEAEKRRSFLVQVLEDCDDKAVLACSYKQTCLVIALVRDRIEREKTVEAEEREEVGIND